MDEAPPPFEKDFYMEHPAVSALSRTVVDAWCHQHQIVVSGNDGMHPKAVRTFMEASFPDYLTAELEAAGLQAPTPIQSQSWPIILSGWDMIGLAATGSGKTLSFALPAMVHIMAQDHLQAGDGPIALMLAPTRELALQIHAECQRFGATCGVKSTCLYGGVPRGPQMRDLQQGVEVVIATPGRLLDFLDAGKTNLRRTTYLVLDEADRMLDLGFEAPLRTILGQVRPERQTLMLSATWPREVEKLAAEFLSRPLRVQVGGVGALPQANRSVTQHFEACSEEQRLACFLHILRRVHTPAAADRCLIFCASKRGCESLRTDLRRRGFAAETLHGDKSQQERDWALSQFRGGASPLLIATDVASRGLDIKGVRAVINFDAPQQTEDYVHRVGRVGRAGATGDAFTIITPTDGAFAAEAARMLLRTGMGLPRELMPFVSGARGAGPGGGGLGGSGRAAGPVRRWR
jgi:ATP-dependent RNA helicase DDX5/DBP2